MMPFKAVIYMAINNGWLQRDPFYAYSITKEDTERGFLTREDIGKMIATTFKRKSYEVIRDLFVFCCFTGLTWIDMRNLTEQHLQTAFDGHLWIKTKRQKTGVESDIRLLDVPLHILEKYKGLGKDGHVLPVADYNTCRAALKRVAALSGIDKNVTWHTRSHFAFSF